MRPGSPEPCRGECGFVIEKTFRTRPRNIYLLCKPIQRRSEARGSCRRGRGGVVDKGEADFTAFRQCQGSLGQADGPWRHEGDAFKQKVWSGDGLGGEQDAHGKAQILQRAHFFDEAILLGKRCGEPRQMRSMAFKSLDCGLGKIGVGGDARLKKNRGGPEGKSDI